MIDVHANQLPTQPHSRPNVIRLPQIELLVEREGGKPTTRTVVVDSDFIRIGSHESNDLVLNDRSVSRLHCTMERSANGFRLNDAGSLNGTWVYGIRVRDADILPDCRIDIGESSLRLRPAATVSETTLPEAINLGAMFGGSVRMRRLFHLVRTVAKSSSDVLIEGENGTGKEVIATELVQRSPRGKKPLIIVDCGAISPSLIESELFGHVRGAFTHAVRDRAGALEEADGGTVFLDEIGELPLDVQPKLLRALASREVRRVGDNRLRKVDIRVIAATNRRLDMEVNNGRFREDLYYRLSVVTVRVPPLRERKEDIPILVQHFIRQFGALDKEHLFTPELLEDMSRHNWPGNVRELKNYVERRIALGTEMLADVEQDISPRTGVEGASAAPEVSIEVPFKQAKESVVTRFERAYLEALLAWSGGNVTRASKKARLDRIYLHRLLQRYGLRRGAALD
jgi:transcriptional regulator with GAF, ATPase, and Fis domain